MKNLAWEKALGRRSALGLCAFALLVSGGFFLAWRAGGHEIREIPALALSGESAGTQAEQDPMQAFRVEREQLRSMEASQLNDIIHDQGTDEETRQAARRQLLDLWDWAEKETTVEGVLLSRGFVDAICTVHGDSVNVLIRGQAVGRQESAVIYDLVLRETGVTGGNVKIVPVG